MQRCKRAHTKKQYPVNIALRAASLTSKNKSSWLWVLVWQSLAPIIIFSPYPVCKQMYVDVQSTSLYNNYHRVENDAASAITL